MVQEARVSGTVVGMQQMELPISTFPNAFSRGGIPQFESHDSPSNPILAP